MTTQLVSAKTIDPRNAETRAERRSETDVILSSPKLRIQVHQALAVVGQICAAS
jgi:hypothetical protein